MDQTQPSTTPCTGPLGRREFLRLGLAGLGSLTWQDLLRRRAQAKSDRREQTALLVVWLWGGASHLETYDPKPLAPSEYRGPYQPIRTRVPGMQLCELLPRHAQVAHRFTLLRSLTHSGVCHQNGPQSAQTIPSISSAARRKPESSVGIGRDCSQSHALTRMPGERIRCGCAGIARSGCQRQ